MNIQHYILRVLLVFVCLFVLFSHSLTVCATDDGIATLALEDEDVVDNSMSISMYLSNGNFVGFGNTGFVNLSNDLTYLSASNITRSNSTTFYDYFDFKKNDGSILFNKNESFTLNITNIRSFLTIQDLDTNNISTFGLSSISSFTPYDGYTMAAKGTDINGNVVWFGCSEFNVIDKTNKYNMYFKFDTIPTDIYTLRVYVKFDAKSAYNISSNYFDVDNYIITRAFGFSESDFSFHTEDSTNSLLGNIIEIIKSIWTGITELPGKIANSIKGFFDNIVNAVVNLGNTILDGIKSLFIPSEEDITNMKDKWDTLLSDRFGALYQVTSLISDYAGSFKDQSKNTITFPSISIPLAGATFEFGGWEVQVVPDGFGIIFDTLKMITSILATMLFINGLKNRFDKIMGGADDI